MAFRKENKTEDNFSKISTGLTSPEEILGNSSSEVLKPETISYRTYKPEHDGLFCKRIFGPIKDCECHRGKYKRICYKGIVCGRCGVEATERKVRRERMGYIQLVVPVAHVQYSRSLPNKIDYLFGLPTKKPDLIVYYERCAVIQPGVRIEDGIAEYDLLSEEEYLDILDILPKDNQYLEDNGPNKLIAKMGAEAIYDLLARLDLDALSYELHHRVGNDAPQQRKNEALRRPQVVESFRTSHGRNKPERMIVCIILVIPPEFRPLIPLDGGCSATPGLNNPCRRVIIRNNRLKGLIEVKVPEVILCNKKRMFQESAGSLSDNPCRSSVVRTDANRPLKSLSDSLRDKQGRFRQNLPGKRVDYSTRSIVVIGPELKMGEYSIPRLTAVELYKPFITRRFIRRGIARTAKSAKKIVDHKEAVIWDILERVVRGHPVLSDHALMLHCLDIQVLQPRTIKGKAIQLHPLACTTFNTDSGGDQMVVHLLLSSETILEVQILTLQSHNILNPTNGASITVPAQNMILGLYYVTKLRAGAKGERPTFYEPEKVLTTYSEGKVDIYAPVKMIVKDVDENGNIVNVMCEIPVGRVIVNETVPSRAGYINMIISKKSFRDIISDVIRVHSVAKAVGFLDRVKNLGYQTAFKGGLSSNLGDIIILEEKEALIQKGYDEVEQVVNNYNIGLITSNKRYNQVIDIWTHVDFELPNTLMEAVSSDDQGSNFVYMMLDSDVHGSREQVHQLSGIHGLTAGPQKAGAEGDQIIEDLILSNLREGPSVLECFISVYSARKGLTDTALKTADAGYLTRRLVGVPHDVIIMEEGYGTLRGSVCIDLKNNSGAIATLYERILGRVSIHDIIHPTIGELLAAGGEEITEEVAKKIRDSPIESVKICSVLTCETKEGVCAKCYGRNLAISRMVQKDEAVGVITTQSIGEPGTQLTLCVLHTGGTVANIAANASTMAKNNTRLELEKLHTVDIVDEIGETAKIVVGRLVEIRFMDVDTGIILSTYNVPYDSTLYISDGDLVEKGKPIAKQDPFNTVIIIEATGKIESEGVIEDVTYKVGSDEATGLREIIITESKDRTKVPLAHTLAEDGDLVRTYSLPVGGHVIIEDGQEVKAGEVVVKIPRAVGRAGDITDGLPRVTELLEAHNPSNSAVVSEIDGEVTTGKIRRSSCEVIVTSKTSEVRKYLVALPKQILVQESDYVRVGTSLSDGATTSADILVIKGPTAIQEYIVSEVQDVYRLQGVKINDKHFEVTARQMMRKAQIGEPGDTRSLEQQIVDKLESMEEDDRTWGRKVAADVGGSQNMQLGQIVTTRKLRDENSVLKRHDLKSVEVRDAVAAASTQILQDIMRAALQTSSLMLATSPQKITEVLNEVVINGKTGKFEGIEGNVTCGHSIPAGTGQRGFEGIVAGPKEEYDRILMNKKTVLDYNKVE